MDEPHAIVETTIQPFHDQSKVSEALVALFPTLSPLDVKIEVFPTTQEEQQWTFDNVDLTNFLDSISKQRILDTALDAMGANLHNDNTIFSLSRQAASAGKVAFVLNDEKTLGGTFEVTLSGNNLAAWIEEATWHQGRVDFPRSHAPRGNA